jgi:hypothetical protein
LSTTLNQTEIAARHHRRATRWFWLLLIGATLVSIVGNIVHALLPYISMVAIQIGVATVPPIGLLVAVHSIAHVVRGGASGRVYHWAVGAVVIVGTAAFAVSFIALRDLMVRVGYSPRIAGLFPVIIDCVVGVATVALVALGDKPARRPRTVSTQIAPAQRPGQGANAHLNAPGRTHPVQPRIAQTPVPSAPEQAQTSAPSVLSRVASAHGSAHTTAHADDADLASLAADLIGSGVTTQPVDTVVVVLAARRNGASINAAANASGINYRTAQRIVEGAAEHRQRQLAAVR